MPRTTRTNRVAPKQFVSKTTLKRREAAARLEKSKPIKPVVNHISQETLHDLQVKLSQTKSFNRWMNIYYMNEGVHAIAQAVGKSSGDRFLDTLGIMSTIFNDMEKYYKFEYKKPLKKPSALITKMYTSCGFYVTPITMQFKDKRSDTLLRNASIFVDESLRTIDLASKQLKPTSEAARFNYGIMLQLKTISQEIKRTVKLKKAINDSEKIARINLALQISAAAVCLGLIVTACVASLGIAPAVAAAAVAAAIVCHALWANYNKNKAVARVLESDFDVPSKSMEGGRIEIANRVELAVEKSVDAIHEAYKEMVSVTMEVKV